MKRIVDKSGNKKKYKKLGLRQKGNYTSCVKDCSMKKIKQWSAKENVDSKNYLISMSVWNLNLNKRERDGKTPCNQTQVESSKC